MKHAIHRHRSTSGSFINASRRFLPFSPVDRWAVRIVDRFAHWAVTLLLSLNESIIIYIVMFDIVFKLLLSCRVWSVIGLKAREESNLLLILLFPSSHSVQVCQPIMADGTNCSHPLNAGRYIEDFTCTGDWGNRTLKEVRLSFPSGHSSFSAYTMVYCAVSTALQYDIVRRN